MGDPRRTAERNAGAFLSPDLGNGGGMIPVPVNAMSVGTGEPGPEDEWKMPALPEDEVKPAEEAAPQPGPAEHGSSLLHRLTHRD